MHSPIPVVDLSAPFAADDEDASLDARWAFYDALSILRDTPAGVFQLYWLRNRPWPSA